MQPYRRAHVIRERTQHPQVVQDTAYLATVLRDVISNVNPDYDYKDRSAAISSGLWDALTYPQTRVVRQALKQAHRADLLEGYSCPRSTAMAVDRFLAL